GLILAANPRSSEGRPNAARHSPASDRTQGGAQRDPPRRGTSGTARLCRCLDQRRPHLAERGALSALAVPLRPRIGVDLGGGLYEPGQARDERLDAAAAPSAAAREGLGDIAEP